MISGRELVVACRLAGGGGRAIDELREVELFAELFQELEITEHSRFVAHVFPRRLHSVLRRARRSG